MSGLSYGITSVIQEMASGYSRIQDEDQAEQGLAFKSFTPEETRNGSVSLQNTSRNDRDYLSDQSPKSTAFWTLEYYQQYFDVDTKTVITRCWTTLNPLAASTYTSTQLSPSPDLYGPFWTLTSLIFSLFVFSSLAASIASLLSSPDQEYQYNFQLLSIAVSLVYAYGLGMPTLLWAALKYFGIGDWGLVEALAIWGYGQFIWIPVAILNIIPIPLFRWSLVALATGLSGWFLLANLNPVLASSDSKAPRALLLLVAALHVALALTFKVLFFSYYIIKEVGPGAGEGLGDGES